MVIHRFGKTAGAVVALLALGGVPAFASLSATATISGAANGPNYDYTIKLSNTGTTDIGTFWFAWTPPGDPIEYDFLPSLPSATSQPTGWVGSISPGFPGNSIEYYNLDGASDNILPGHTGTFTFTSVDSPATLQGLDTQFHFFPITESFIYAGLPESGPFAEVNPVFVAATPEPASLGLLGLAGLGILLGRRRRRA